MRIALIILLVIPFWVGAQNVNEDFSDPNSLPLPSDSTSAPIQNGTLKTIKTIFSGKPGRAAVYGLVIPGGGQLYNRRYWKAPIVWAADAGAIAYFIYNRRLWLGFQEAYACSFVSENCSYLGISNQEALRGYRNQFQLNTERAGITILVLHLVSVIEAFTDRHLMEFDIDDNLSFHQFSEPLPAQVGLQTGLALRYTF